MRKSLPYSRRPDLGFTLTELLVVIVVAALLVAGFTGFYVSEQRALKHDQIEIETSQALRTAIEQISRYIRSARKDLTRDFLATPPSGGADPHFLNSGVHLTDATHVDFQLDADDDAVVAADGSAAAANEHIGFRLNGTTIEQLDAASGTDTWNTLAENVAVTNCPNSAIFTYQDCNGNTPSSLDLIESVNICITASRAVIGGLPVNRTETERVRLRNVKNTFDSNGVRCP
jgi:prepilin-type N-terminal cleavage/methylation domain-containing protein